MPPTPPRKRRIRFYKTPAGNAVARGEFLGLHEAGQAVLHQLFTRFENDAALPGEVQDIGQGLIEFRSSVGHNQYRAYAFEDGPRYVIVLVCVQKKRAKASPNDINLAKRRRASWRANQG